MGIFLVHSLLRGLANRDGIRELVNRFHELPTDLERYFEHMMDTIEPVYQVQTARVFKIMVAAGSSLPLISFHFLDQEFYDSSYSVTGGISPFTDQELEEISNDVTWKLNARCRDLLHVTSDLSEPEGSFFRYRLGFLHRTVMDYLQTSHIDDVLTTRCGPEFRPTTVLCKIFLAQSRALSPVDEIARRSAILGTLYYARRTEEVLGNSETGILNALEMYTATDEWPSIIGPVEPPEALVSPVTFKIAVVMCGLSTYVRESLSSSVTWRQEGHKLLHSSLHSRVIIENELDFTTKVLPEVDVQMVNCLMDSGISPNQEIPHKFGPQTIWCEFLFRLERESRPYPSDRPQVKMKNSAEICKLIILHGACRIVERRNFQGAIVRRDAVEIFSNIFSPVEADILSTYFAAEQRKEKSKGCCVM